MIRNSLIIALLAVGIATSAAQEPAGVTRGGYSPAFAQAAASDQPTCPVLKDSAPPCTDYDPASVHEVMRFRNGDCAVNEVRANDLFTGKACMLGTMCRCGNDS